MPTSFAINAMVKPALKSRLRISSAIFPCVAALRPDEALSTSTIFAGSSPMRSPTMSASHADDSAAAEQ